MPSMTGLTQQLCGRPREACVKSTCHGYGEKTLRTTYVTKRRHNHLDKFDIITGPSHANLRQLTSAWMFCPSHETLVC